MLTCKEQNNIYIYILMITISIIFALCQWRSNFTKIGWCHDFISKSDSTKGTNWMKGMGGVCAERGCTKTITHPEGGSEISLYLIFNWRMRGGVGGSEKAQNCVIVFVQPQRRKWHLVSLCIVPTVPPPTPRVAHIVCNLSSFPPQFPWADFLPFLSFYWDYECYGCWKCALGLT